MIRRVKVQIGIMVEKIYEYDTDSDTDVQNAAEQSTDDLLRGKSLASLQNNDFKIVDVISERKHCEVLQDEVPQTKAETQPVIDNKDKDNSFKAPSKEMLDAQSGHNSTTEEENA